MDATPSSKQTRFLELLRPLERGLETYARRLLWDPQDLPDAVQASVLHAYAAFDRYREGTCFRAWIYTILTREVFALNRRHARRAAHEFHLGIEALEALAGPDGGAEPGLAALETNPWEETIEPDLVRALHRLSDLERAVLLLRALSGFRYREISEALGIPLGSVMGDLARARQKMRAALAHRSPGVAPMRWRSS
ncbi:MAG TPA: sigma-70 family RNA polymerase sigma factor [Verrucomicrobiota bacterium]|nr:sigma-70 family RNA polymerase sigma factor [Verrucomicrobiota bacterium]